MGRLKAESVLRKLNHQCITCGRPAKQKDDGTYYSVCEVCYKRVKYHNKRKAKARNDFDRRPTLCWSCKHSLPIAQKGTGCPWSRGLKPVEGWKAIPTEQKVSETRTVKSFTVLECPLYERGCKDDETDGDDTR